MTEDFSMADFFASVDVAVMGRKTFEVGMKLGGGSLGHTNMTNFVFSRKKPESEWKDVVFVNQPADSLMQEIRNKLGKDIWLMGGGEMAREFLQADLVDEIHLGIVPVALGEGSAVSERLSAKKLRFDREQVVFERADFAQVPAGSRPEQIEL